MAISKTTAIAGTLGGGGGAAITGITIKYVISKEETLDSIKSEIQKWGKEENNGNCSIKVKFQGENTTSQKLSEITEDSQKANLKNLLETLESEQKNSTAKSECQKAKGNVNKFLIDKQETGDNNWIFTAEDATLQEVKDNISSWSSNNGGCKIKVKFQTSTETPTELSEIQDTGNNKADLINLYGSLSSSTPTPTAKSICTEINSGNNKFLMITKNNSSWEFKKDPEEQ